ncbi:MAG: TIGR01459 family HAD-type hydrolase, partial [Pseudomonadota bacterium]
MTTRLIERLDTISHAYDALLCDVWGCYHNGLQPFPAAVAALQGFRARGGTVVLLTNAPRPAASVAQFLDGMGAPRDSYDAIMSSGEACVRALGARAHGERIHYVGPERDLHMLAQAGLAPATLDEAEAVLCTGLFDDSRETPEDYAEAITAWRARGLPMLCANPDVVVDRGTQRLWCAGALAEAYARAGGEVIW